MSSRCPVCDRRVLIDQDGHPCSTPCEVTHLQASGELEEFIDQLKAERDEAKALLSDALKCIPEGWEGDLEEVRQRIRAFLEAKG